MSTTKNASAIYGGLIGAGVGGLGSLVIPPHDAQASPLRNALGGALVGAGVGAGVGAAYSHFGFGAPKQTEVPVPRTHAVVSRRVVLHKRARPIDRAQFAVALHDTQNAKAAEEELYKKLVDIDGHYYIDDETLKLLRHGDPALVARFSSLLAHMHEHVTKHGYPKEIANFVLFGGRTE